jgi:hypothetical protein
MNGVVDMIEFAVKHEAALQALFLKHAFDEKFKYYWCYSWRIKYVAPESTWEKMEFAVLENGEVTGFLGYSVERDTQVISSFGAINFSGSSLAFAKAMMKTIDDMFMVFKFRKLRFCVEVGNPIEPSYDRMVAKFGGRVCGLFRAENKLFDGTITDRKWYEIMREEYIGTRNS